MNLLNSSTISSVLLSGARARNAEAWGQILAIFNPKITRWMCRANVAEADQPDLIQEVWRSVLGSIQNFRREAEGDTFGGWLRRITQRRVADYFEEKSGQPRQLSPAAEPAFFAEFVAESSCGSPSNRSRRMQLALRQVQAEVQPETWQVFYMHVVEEMSVQDVAGRLRVPEHKVYTCKSRVMKRLREAMQSLENPRDEP